MLSSLQAGDLIVAECTDPLTVIDIPNLLRQTGDALEGKAEADGRADVPDSQEVASVSSGRRKPETRDHPLGLVPAARQ